MQGGLFRPCINNKKNIEEVFMTDHKHKKPDEEKKLEPELVAPDNAQPEQPAEAAAPKGKNTQPLPQVPMIALSMEEYTTMQSEKEKYQQDSKDYLDGWQRERAEFQNFRRRIERDQAQAKLDLTGQVIKKYLVILDDIERAMKNRPSEGEGAAWAAGIELIYRKLQNILENEGVERIPAEIQFFDPTIHEALMQEDSPNHESGQIIEVVQQGYKIGDRVLRPALVRVAK
jgi:molecular chaperone GrpE